jgi:hypothetical protein
MILLAFSLIILQSCVQKTHKKIVRITLDMRETDQHKKVGIRGQFPLSWQETTYLQDEDKDGIYQGEFEFYTVSNQIEFKFVNQDEQYELEDQPNRVISFQYKPENMTYSAVFNKPNGKLEKE